MGTRRKRSASAMLQTLALITLVMLAAFSMAMSSMSQLNLSSRYSQHTQADYAAHAAMTEAVIRLRKIPPPEDITVLPPSPLTAFKDRERLLARTPRIPGEATLLLTRCVDNSMNPDPVASTFDQGERKSVPPFSLSLVYEVTMGTRTYVYESLIQQRWPYALAVPGPVTICGRLEDTALPQWGQGLFRAAASEINGKILGMRVGMTSELNPFEPIEVSDALYSQLYSFAGRPAGASNRVVIGGSVRLARINFTSERVGGANYGFPIRSETVNSAGAVTKGGIDLFENQESGADGRSLPTSPEVRVAEGNTQQGRIRRDYKVANLPASSELSRNLMHTLFQKTDTTSWSQVMVPLESNVVLARSGTPVPEGHTLIPIPDSGRCRIAGDYKPSAGMVGTYAVGGEGRWSAKGSLTLDNAALAVDGDMSLENRILRGSNATLIVDGTLTLDGGYLDAGDNGLVIYCRRLLMKAKGRFNGLIIVEQGAAIYGGGVPAAGTGEDSGPSVATADLEPELRIKGGLLVGGQFLQVQLPPPPPSDDGGTPPTPPPIELCGLTLVSTRIEYEPRYLRGLNRFGNYELIATDQRH